MYWSPLDSPPEEVTTLQVAERKFLDLFSEVFFRADQKIEKKGGGTTRLHAVIIHYLRYRTYSTRSSHKKKAIDIPYRPGFKNQLMFQDVTG